MAQILTVTKNKEGTWEADNFALPGAPYVGRGATYEEAIARWFINNQKMFGYQIDVKED